MNFLLTLIVIFEPCVSQWTAIAGYYSDNIYFQNQTNVGGFNIPSQPKSAYFIDCVAPATSYITLTSQISSLISESEIELNSGDFLTLDVFYQGNWNNGILNIKFGNEITPFGYSSPQQYPITNGFCNNINTDVDTIILTLQTSQKIQAELQITSTVGQVSIKNFYISRLLCYPLCKSCTGSEYNQCTSCQNGLPNNNRCSLCPNNQVWMPQIGCCQNCHFYYRKTYENICVSFESSIIYKESIYPSEFKYTTIPNIIELSEYVQASNAFQHGIHSKNSGIYRFIELSSFDQGIYLIGLKLVISLYDSIPVGGRIEFQINNTYYGSIYQTAQGTNFHRVSIYQTQDCNLFNHWTICKMYSAFMFVDIPKYSFFFKAVGNYKTSNSAWSLRELEVSSGFCPNNCKYCEIPYVCQICNDNFYVLSDGNCVKCEEYYQTQSNKLCNDYEYETPYSKFLIKNEYFSKPSSSYVLVSQQSSNFLKGSAIYYSIWNGQYIFGGQYVWSQAKFKLTNQIQKPHHSVTIGFSILYGPNFSQDSQFLYYFENNQPIIKSKISATLSNVDNTASERVKLTFQHSANTLTQYWECRGNGNNPINAYCGVYGYNIVVHYCSPYCLECLSEVSCTKWDNSVDVKFHSEKGCQTNTYYNKQEQKCLTCPETCLTCTSDVHCQSCKFTLMLSDSRCICLMNQYYANNQCYECPIGCNQCIDDQVCVECLAANNRELVNGKCDCVQGYYSISDNPVCQKCNSQSTCSCSLGTSYDVSSNSCKSCHSSCQTCFRLSIDGCLSCNINNNRVLKGLKCVCMPGYYEQNNICLSCPSLEQSIYVQCYKLCFENTLIWHTQVCMKCDPGFKLIYGECMPICGDFLVVGYEQCEDGNNDLNDLCFNCQYQCPSDCVTCTSTTTLPCTGYCGDMIVNGTEECDDGNQIQYDGCHNCKFQCSSNCINCIRGKCAQCVTKKQIVSFSMSSNNCLLQCGSGYLIESLECMNDTSSVLDQCQKCRFNCRSNCSNCDYTTGTCLDCDLPGFKPYSSFCKNICGDGLIVQDPTNFYNEYCDDGNIVKGDLCSNQCKNECQEEGICINCINTRCYACGIGYELNENYFCNSICGDSIKTKDEICDAELPYRGCFKCQPKCQSSCLDCDIQGRGCLKCQEGYQNVDNMCYTICGDNFVTPDEQCDDGNQIFEDGCHQCQQTCTNGCSFCYEGVCYDCQDGFYYFKHQCIKINEKFHDPRCNSDCLTCSIEGYGCMQCNNGFQRIDNTCHPICGDMVKVESEQCDDQNLIFEDGCHQCQKSCTIGCSFCFQGVCYKCHEGFYYFKYKCIKINEKFHDPRCNSDCLTCSIEGYGCMQCNNGFQRIDNTCHPICGDMVKVESEQCDDQNLLFQDGCHQCYLNCEFPCKACIQGVCYQCEDHYFIYENTCYAEIENEYQYQLTNFQFKNLFMKQSFPIQLIQFNRIQFNSPQFSQQIYNQNGIYTQMIDNNVNSLDFEVDIRCSQNMKITIEINNYQFTTGFVKQSAIFPIECHKTRNHVTSLSFQLNKIKVKDEILVIIINENESKVALIMNQFLQSIFSCKFVYL